MAKSSNAEHLKRLNAAYALLTQAKSSAQAAEVLAERFRVSLRQAYRYLQRASMSTALWPPPEDKTLFAVKLPVSLAEHVRRHARSAGRPISELVTEALGQYLDRSKDGGA